MATHSTFTLLSLLCATLVYGQDSIVISDYDCLRDTNQANSNSPYEATDTVVVRRGNSIQVSITASGLDLQRVSLDLISYDDGSTLSLQTVTVNEDGSSEYTLQGKVPVNAPVGSYYVSVNGQWLSCNFLVIFNPWNKNDDTYCAIKSYRNSYMLSTEGTVFLDSEKIDRSIPWKYAQFDWSVVRTLQHYLPALSSVQRRNPATVAHYLQSLIQGTILWGSWSSFSGGTNPLYWRSSTEILQKHVSYSFTTVRYGQCWVFAAVLTSLLRGIGIVSRQVMCKPCAHNDAESVTTNMYFDSHGTNCCCQDFWWNFHNWSECYLRRKDWTSENSVSQFQAIDGTYAVGPAPRTAIDSGELGNWDVNFFEAEVKSSVVYWHPITGTQMYELDPIEEDKTPTVWTMALGSSATDSATEITSDYRSSRDIYSAPSNFQISVKLISYAVDVNPSSFTYRIKASGGDIRLSVIVSVSLGNINVPCAETSLAWNYLSLSLTSGQYYQDKISFSMNSASSSLYQFYLRVFLQDLDTGEVALWQRRVTPISMYTAALKERGLNDLDSSWQDNSTRLNADPAAFNSRV